MVGDVYDRQVDNVTRVVWEAIRAWRAAHGITDRLPWIDATNTDKAGLMATVQSWLTRIQYGEDIELQPDAPVEDIITLNLIYTLAGEEP